MTARSHPSAPIWNANQPRANSSPNLSRCVQLVEQRLGVRQEAVSTSWWAQLRPLTLAAPSSTDRQGPAHPWRGTSPRPRAGLLPVACGPCARPQRASASRSRGRSELPPLLRTSSRASAIKRAISASAAPATTSASISAARASAAWNHAPPASAPAIPSRARAIAASTSPRARHEWANTARPKGTRSTPVPEACACAKASLKRSSHAPYSPLRKRPSRGRPMQ
jgi:hypothetical protein